MMKEIDALLGAEDANDVEAETTCPEKASAGMRPVRAAPSASRRADSLDDWLVENFGRDKSLASLDFLDHTMGGAAGSRPTPGERWVPEKARLWPGCVGVPRGARLGGGRRREGEDAAREERRVRAGGRWTRAADRTGG